jgi:hypothetical protein
MSAIMRHLVLLLLTATALFLPSKAIAADPTNCIPGMTTWWRLNGNGSDSLGGFQLTLINGPAFTAGQVGQGLLLDGIDDYALTPAAAALDIGAASGMTIEMWIKPSNAAKVAAAILEWNTGNDIGVHLSTSTGATRDLFANLLDTSGNSHQLSSGANTLVDNVFQHIAVTYDKTTGMGRMYINGNQVASANLGVFTPQTSYPLSVGVRPGPGGLFDHIYFPGVIDEISLYDRPLSQVEIQNIVLAGASGKCSGASAPLITTQPQGTTIFESNSVNFFVVAQGQLPLSYQWRFNNSPLAGQTQSNLTLTNVQLAQAGPYTVVVSNAGGSVTSSVATLTVNPTPTCSVSSGIAAWWKFNGNGLNESGLAPMTLNNGATYGVGEVGQGLFLDGANDYARADAPSLNIGVGSGMSIEMWIKPANAAKVAAAIVEWNNGSIGTHLSTSVQGDRDLYANLLDTSGNSHQLTSGPYMLVNNVFQHIAVTYDKTTGMGRMYINGIQVASANLGIFTPQTSYPLNVGVRPGGVFANIYFPGIIDELSLYSRVLSQAEVQSIYSLGAAGKCSAPQPLVINTQPQSITTQESNNVAFTVVAQGTQPVQYQWYFEGQPLAGRTEATLSLTNVMLPNDGNYYVVVSDVSGSVTSTVAHLTVIVPLGIRTHPRSITTVVGGTATFSAVAQGSGVISYQWFFNGAPIIGATSSNLTIVSPQGSDAGRYFLVISNASLSVTSAVVFLNVVPDWTPIITEFMAQNDGPVMDADFEFSDWIEIHNPTAFPMSIEDWCLTDDPVLLTKWRFPGVMMPPYSYLLVFASGKNRFVPELHTNFRLDADGGYVALVKPDGVTIANEFIYPSQRSSVSYGLAGSSVFFPQPTPGTTNNLGVFGFVKDTKFDTNRGFFYAPFNLTITCATPGAALIYTTNGDIPSFSSGIQVPPLNATSPPQAVVQIAATKVVRAAAYKDGFVPSGTDTHTYVFPSSVVNQTRPPGASATWIEDPPGSGGSFAADFTVTASVVNNALPGYSFTNALVSIPTVSIVSPMDGLFGPVNGMYTRPLMEGTNWERAISMELIYPDGHEGFHVGAGAQMHGDVSELPHTIPKHPLRIFFRDKYGPTKLQYDLFGGSVDKFDQLILRSCSTDAWPISNDLLELWNNADATYQRDQWMRDAQIDLGKLSARGIYVHLYLNGLYWGLYNLTERINDSFAADHVGGRKEDYDVIQGELIGGTLHVASAGTDATWLQMLQVANQVPGNAAKYWEIQGLNTDGTRNPNLPVLVDMDNFIDYMLLHIYAPAVDWPNRNWWALRQRDTSPTQLDSTGFKFLTWDQEIAVDRLNRTTTWYNNQPFELVNQGDTPAQIYDRLRNHPEFRLRFGDHIQKHLLNGGALTIAANRARWAERAAEIDHAIVGESARWGDVRRNPAFTREADWLRMSNFTQNTYWPGNEVSAWQRFRNVGLYPSVGAPIFSQFGGNVPANFQLTITHTNPGGIIFYTVDGSDPRGPGGIFGSGAQFYSQPVSITSPTLVRARVNNGANWSAIVEAQFFPPQDLSKLQLSEIMYNPPKFGSIDGDEVEFLELKNVGTNALDLSGLTFTRGLNFTFSNETWLAAGQYFVLARNATQFAARYSNAPLHGIYTGKLDNNGETLELATALGVTVFSVKYNNAAPWPAEADNSGLSLQRMSFSLHATNPVSWVAYDPTPGGPLPAAWQDSDGDGLPDGWEQTYGFVQGVDESNDDTDDDGLTNLQEFISGTNPLLASDALRLTPISVTSSANNVTVLLGFNARSNKTYTVVYRDTVPGSPWTQLLNVGVASTNRSVTITDIVPAATRFYRLASPKLP